MVGVALGMPRWFVATLCIQASSRRSRRALRLGGSVLRNCRIRLCTPAIVARGRWEPRFGGWRGRSRI